MTRVTIELDDDVSGRLTAHAAAAGYADLGGYIGSLVRHELDDADALETPDGPPQLAVGSDAELERLLLSRLGGGPSIPATPQFWADLRQRAGLPAPGTRP